ncbi:RidA family protein [Amycolatopsis sp. SID8362]|uniref:RidA family protein n=1 Tax=Amycolatopsis sp. SID8362 TaxID=2690346 RepID=UPI001370E938|nr:RidA family protein [Amycolatopsis sp. SID8362]NBH04750.1 RidA family protein [Amycolatopsis sp. SID8362]NED41450.1 RidA family protein [Amycolatopsis sp. SID8362]
MPVSLINPDGHVVVPDYHHVAVATGGTQVHLAGQVAWDENGALVAPGDLAGQVVQVYRNVAKSLAAAGATFADVVRVTWYAAGWRRERYDDFRAGVEQAMKELDITATPPAALIGVEILFDPEILVEAEVTAVVDRSRVS